MGLILPAAQSSLYISHSSAAASETAISEGSILFFPFQSGPRIPLKLTAVNAWWSVQSGAVEFGAGRELYPY